MNIHMRTPSNNNSNENAPIERCTPPRPHLREDLRRDEREEHRAVDGLVEAEREVGGDAELRRVDRGDADELGRLDAKGDGEGVEAHRAVACVVVVGGVGSGLGRAEMKKECNNIAGLQYYAK